MDSDQREVKSKTISIPEGYELDGVEYNRRFLHGDKVVSVTLFFKEDNRTYAMRKAKSTVSEVLEMDEVDLTGVHNED